MVTCPQVESHLVRPAPDDRGTSSSTAWARDTPWRHKHFLRATRRALQPLDSPGPPDTVLVSWCRACSAAASAHWDSNSYPVGKKRRSRASTEAPLNPSGCRATSQKSRSSHTIASRLNIPRSIDRPAIVRSYELAKDGDFFLR